MAEQIPQGHPEETKERGCFEFVRKKEEKIEDVLMTDAAKDSKEEKHAPMDELQHTQTHSSSSSDEEVEEGGERKKKKQKKKKGLKEAIKVQKSGENVGEDNGPKDTCVPKEKCSKEENAESGRPDEKKGLIEKIKEKFPGQHKKGELDTQTLPASEHSPGSDSKEKKGIMDKIMEKLPGHHKNNDDKVKN